MTLRSQPRNANGLTVLWWYFLARWVALAVVFPLAMILPESLAILAGLSVMAFAYVLLRFWKRIEPMIHPRVDWFFAGLLRPLERVY